MTDRELLDRKGHEVNDDLPPPPEPKYIYHRSDTHGEDDLFEFAVCGAVDTDSEGRICQGCERLYTASQVEEIRRAAVLAERERCAKVCEADPDAVFAAIWKSLVIPGEFDAMDETDKNRWRGVIMQAIGFTAELKAAAIRGVKT